MTRLVKLGTLDSSSSLGIWSVANRLERVNYLLSLITDHSLLVTNSTFPYLESPVMTVE